MRAAGRLIFAMAAVAMTASAQEPSTQEALAQEPAAQQAPDREIPAQTGFHFSSPLAVNAVRERNIPVAQSRFSDDLLLLTAPELAFQSAAPRTNFFLGYKPEFQLFKHHNDLNTWDNAARFRLTHQSTPRLRFDAQDSFLHTEDPGRVIADSVFLLPRGQFWGNSFSLTADYDLSPQTRFSPAYLNTVSKLLLPGITETELFTGRFEQMGNAALFAVSHMLGLQHQVTGSYAFFVIQDLKRGLRFPFATGANAQSTHGIGLAYQYGFRPRGVSVELSAGALLSRSTTYRFAARFLQRWRSFVFATGVSREIALLGGLGGAAPSALRLASGVVPDNFYEMATVELEGNVGQRWGVEFKALAGRSNSGLQIADIESVFGHLRLSYRLTDRIYPFVGAGVYSQGFSEWLQTSLARRRFFAGFAIVLSRPAEWEGGAPGKTGVWPDDPAPGSSSRRRQQSEQWGEELPWR